ncbi:predicted protein [Scheffersomyces stipitis CBS 6054]|uniref:Uncharacterized protein n=1 Tax=Scheffersomyces stipitis (strain ATCC 58785 / CBS 6054 / NBRC 10063 / NRRL Y-11545) TaxID=322104 RepID=A3LVR3_PICST|nr:predicted protein [Scheffersomyces stipitis CBS 6054]ABN67165.2 predicted protein [Scheffersomyces stipitis CBS 6054]
MELDSDSSSSSSEEEDDLLALISGQKGASQNSDSKPKSRSSTPMAGNRTLRSQTQEERDLKDEFEIELPSIFTTDARKNDHIIQQAKELEKQAMEEKQEMMKQVEKIRAGKQNIVTELNDNGTNGLKTFSLEKDEELIDKIYKNSLKVVDGGLSSRHYYFFSNVFLIHDNSLDTKLPVRTSPFFFQSLQSRNGARSSESFLRNYSIQLVNHCLLTSTNIHELKLLNKQLEKGIKPETTNAPKLTTYIDLIGGNVEDVSNSSMSIPVKLDHVSNHIEMNLIRLSIVLNLHITVSNLEVSRQILDTFILATSDFNANEHAYSTLLEFIRSLFPRITRQYTESRLVQFLVIYLETLTGFTTYIHHEKDGLEKRTRKRDYELQFNHLRLLNLAFSGSEDKSVLRIVATLNCCFLQFQKGSMSMTELSERWYTKFVETRRFCPDANDTKRLLQGLSINNNDSDLKSGNLAVINLIYLNHYRIQLLRFVLVSSYEDNENNAQQVVDKNTFEKIRRQNVDNFNVIVSSINTLRARAYTAIRHLGSMEDVHFDREEIVQFITEDYLVLNYLHSKFDHLLRLIQDDIFYHTPTP